MTTKQIDYCIELARTESFSRGAESMFVSQPTFSYQIKLLEEEVKKYNVGETLPELIFIKNGQEVKRLIGEKNYKDIEEVLKEYEEV